MRNATLALLLVITVCVATLTLWIPAYWPVALFEISVLLIAGVTLFFGSTPENGVRYPLFALSFIVLWGSFQLITGWTVNRFATERAILQWLTLAAVYYAGISLLKDEILAKRLRTGMVWFGFTFALEAILQAYLSPGKVFGLFPTGYHDFVMGTIVYHTHFAVLIDKRPFSPSHSSSHSARPETHIPSWEFRRCCLPLWL
jgi:hypothetical protein